MDYDSSGTNQNAELPEVHAAFAWLKDRDRCNYFIINGKTTGSHQLLQALPSCWRDEEGAKVSNKQDLHAVLKDMQGYGGWMDENRDGLTTLYELDHDKTSLEPFGRRSGKYKVSPQKRKQ